MPALADGFGEQAQHRTPRPLVGSLVVGDAGDTDLTCRAGS